MSEFPENLQEDLQDDERIDDSEIVQTPPQPVRIKIETAAKKPLVTYGLIGLMALLFIGQLVSEQIYGVDLIGFWGMKNNYFIDNGEFWRLLTPMFLHGSITHVLFNLYALLQIGRVLEIQYGHLKFFALYIITGFSGIVFSYQFLQNASSLGSSTAIFGLLAAYGVFAWQNQKIFGEQAKKTFYNVALIAGINFMLGLSPGIDNWGHLGGFVGGLIISWFGGPKYEVVGVPPDLKVINQRSLDQFYGAAVAVFVLFLVLISGLIFISRFS